MNFIFEFLGSSIGRKYIMAATGAAMMGFVLVHLLGNLQIFLGKDIFNAYAHHLHALPFPIFWGFRLVLGLCAIVHIITAITLTIENIRARVAAYKIKKTVQASYASLTMPVTGALLLGFIVLHLLNFTVRTVPENYNSTIPEVSMTIGHAEVTTFDVYAMLISAFSKPWISGVYIVAMALLCLHLSHGFTSVLQTFGLRNEKWRKPLEYISTAYGWIMFLGFASIPAAILSGWIR